MVNILVLILSGESEKVGVKELDTLTVLSLKILTEYYKLKLVYYKIKKFRV